MLKGFLILRCFLLSPCTGHPYKPASSACMSHPREAGLHLLKEPGFHPKHKANSASRGGRIAVEWIPSSSPDTASLASDPLSALQLSCCAGNGHMGTRRESRDEGTVPRPRAPVLTTLSPPLPPPARARVQVRGRQCERRWGAAWVLQ